MCSVQTFGVAFNAGRDLPPEKLRARSQYHGHVSSLELGRLFHNTFFFSVSYDTLEDFQSQFRMGYFSPAEHDSYLCLVVLPEETFDVPQLKLIIMLFGLRANFHFFYLDYSLLLFRLL